MAQQRGKTSQAKGNKKSSATGTKKSGTGTNKKAQGTAKSSGKKAQSTKANTKASSKSDKQPDRAIEKGMQKEFAILIMAGTAVMLIAFLSTVNKSNAGVVGGFITDLLYGTLGIGSWFLAAALIAGSIYMAKENSRTVFKIRAVLTGIFIINLLGLVHSLGGAERYEDMGLSAFLSYVFTHGSYKNGGLVGGMLYMGLYKLVGTVGCYIFFILMTIILIMLISGGSFIGLIRRAVSYAGAVRDKYIDEVYSDDYEDYGEEEDYIEEEYYDEPEADFDKPRIKGEKSKSGFLNFDSGNKRENEISLITDEIGKGNKDKRVVKRDDSAGINIIIDKLNQKNSQKRPTVEIGMGNRSDVDIENIINPPKPDRTFVDDVKSDYTVNIEDKKLRSADDREFHLPKIKIKGAGFSDNQEDRFPEYDYSNKEPYIDEEDPYHNEPYEENPYGSVSDTESFYRDNTYGESPYKNNTHEENSYKSEPREADPYRTAAHEENPYKSEPVTHEESVYHNETKSQGVYNNPPEAENGDEIPPWEEEPEIFKAEETKLVDKLEVEKKPTEYKFPKLEFIGVNLSKSEEKTKQEIYRKARKLEESLAIFNVEAKVQNISIGPTVTRYELIPSTGTKVSAVTKLENDIMFAMAADSIIIEAPIPGKSAIGIEIPNDTRESVFFGEVLRSERFQKFKSNIAFGLGKDITGEVVVSDLAKMPHMLVAGTTGSGKSVCINTIIMSILYKASPQDVKMIMVDPKMVELSIYNGIPHLLLPVVTEPDKAAGALNWAVIEMERRYKLLATTHTRNIAGYNEKVEPEEKLSQIVIIIDELADLMMVVGKEIETSICRLAQKARAAGMHLVLATQRPSADVLTGLIRSNVPSRIAFKVSNAMDSRIILDGVGAEKLLGKGDMLFKTADMPKATRIQGAFITDEEVERVVDYIKVDDPEYDEDIIKQIEQSGITVTEGADGGDDDPLTEEVLGWLVSNPKCASAGKVQRHFRIGFNRASRIIECLEDRGVLGPANGSKPRELLMDKYEYRERKERYDSFDDY